MELIRTERGADGVLLATIDMPGRTMNVFSAKLMDALDALMDRVDADPQVVGVVLTSGKATFLAGADLVMVQGYTDAARTGTHAQMFEMCGRLGRQFVRLEQSAKPWVAAVNGLALGGGLELALACRERLVADDPKLQLGVPEVRWGLLPGAGGTQRLPRMAGFDAALRMLLSGVPVSPGQGLEMKFVNGVVPAAQLVNAARARVLALQGQPLDWTAKFANLDQTDAPPHSEAGARELALAHGVSADHFERYPAYSAIMDCVLLGARLPLAEATAVEMNQFLRLMFSPVAGRMIRSLFLERLRAERELAAPVGRTIAQIAMGPLGTACAAWEQALARVKLPQSRDAALQADTLSITLDDGTRATLRLGVLPGSADASTECLAVLGPAGEYGRVLEIVGGNADAQAAATLLAQKLWCLPWRTPGPRSVLQQLHGQSLEVQHRIATEAIAAPGAGDPAFLDVAACLAGVSPAWSGGPLTCLQSQAQPA